MTFAAARSASRRAHAAYRHALENGVTGERLARLDREAGRATERLIEALRDHSR